MPFEQRATSRAVSLIDALESPDQTKGRILAAVGGALFLPRRSSLLSQLDPLFTGRALSR